MSRRRKKNTLEPGKAGPPEKAAQASLPALRRARRIPVGKKVLFSAVVFIGFLGPAELVLWLAGAPSLIEREDPFRGFSGIVTVFERRGDVFRTRAVSAKETFNDQSFLVDKPAGGVRIFCLGGSSAYGFPWGAESAFTGILGDVLAASHPQLHIEAVNASGLSYGMHRVNLVADELLGYEPDIFIVYSGHNEFVEPAFFEALAMMPNHEGTVHNLSALLIDMGRSAEAVGLLERLVELDPDGGEARYNLGNALQNLGRFEEAIKNYEAAARLRPADADIHISWGITLQKLKRFEGAIAHYQRALELKPDDPDAHNNWGIALQSLGRFEEAVAQYQEALRLRPEFAAAHNNWGLTLESSGRFDEAAAHYQQALQLQPNEAAACRHLGDLFRRQGELGKAEGHYRNAIRLQPGFAAAHYGLGVVLHQQGRSDEAIAQLEQGLLANPQDLVLHSALATIAKQCGDVRKERRHLHTIVQQDASNLPAAERLAWILATSDDDSLRDGKLALQLAQHCVEAGGREQSGPLGTLAAALAETGDFAEAVRWQRKVVELASEPAKTQARQRLQLYEAGKPFRRSPAEMSER